MKKGSVKNAPFSFPKIPPSPSFSREAGMVAVAEFVAGEHAGTVWRFSVSRGLEREGRSRVPRIRLSKGRFRWCGLRNGARDRKEIAMRRRKLARLLRKLRAMRRSCPC